MENPFRRDEIIYPYANDIHAAKPGMDAIQAFFDRRLNHDASQGGIPIRISTDSIGNKVYQSQSTSEGTLKSPTTPAELVAAHEGRQLVLNNPGLLRKIYEGSIRHTAGPFGGLEGFVYKVPLQNGNETRNYALKYTFPIVTGKPNEKIEGVFHSSGIAAMRMMQLAEKARPGGTHFIAPVLATHDITLAPFLDNSIGWKDFVKLEEAVKDANSSSTNPLSPEVRKKLALLIIEGSTTRVKRFQKEVFKALRPHVEEVEDWVEAQTEMPMFRDFQYNFDGGALSQGLVTIDDVSTIFKRFLKDPSYRAGNKTFLHDLVDATHITELGVGSTGIT